MTTNENRAHAIAEVRLLAQRLERLSADSSWARRASGVRGGLLRVLAILEDGGSPAGLEGLLERARIILIRAAREIPAPQHSDPTG